MILSYTDLSGERRTIKAKITTNHPANSLPVIVLPDGDAMPPLDGQGVPRERRDIMQVVACSFCGLRFMGIRDRYFFGYEDCFPLYACDSCYMQLMGGDY